MRTVHAYGSFSRAADTLGVTQSTVSYTIDRLRRVFHDPLFVRQGGRIVPTDRCTEIVGTAVRMINEFTAISEPTAFDPFAAHAQVTLSCNYYERVILIPGLMRVLRKQAPGLRVNILTSTVQGKQQLDRGQSDLLIGPVQIDDGSFFRRRLLRDHYVCVMAPDHPLVGKLIDAQTYDTVPQVVVSYGGNWQSRYLVELAAQGRALNAVMHVPSPATLPDILKGTDMISTVPSRTALAFGDTVHCAPSPMPSPFDIDLYWTVRTHTSAMHMWLRGQVAGVAAGLSP